MEEIHKYFKPIQNKNCYSYVFNKDFHLMVKVEGLWIVIHQKFCILAFRTISLGIAKRLEFIHVLYRVDKPKTTMAKGYVAQKY
jgi:hypothetical protein